MFLAKQMWNSMFGDKDAYPQTVYFKSDNGWMTAESFKNWFETCSLKHMTPGSANLLIFDGHLSHISIELIELALAHNVTLLKLPPHTSHILQPLDVSVFLSLKNKWDRILVDWVRHNVGKRMSKSDFSNLVGLAWKACDWYSLLRSGFKHTGIYDHGHPSKVNRNAIPEKEFNPEKLQRYKNYLSQEASQKNPGNANQPGPSEALSVAPAAPDTVSVNLAQAKVQNSKVSVYF